LAIPSKHNLNVSLTEHLCDFIAGQVASGRFRTASGVVRAALPLLEQDGKAAEQGAETPERMP
jgi:antitoxin ParD1/3/4